MFIDTHSHIIPFVDDGADNWETALELIKQGEKQGIIAALATPHILSENDYRFENQIIERFEELKQKVAERKLKMKLYLGCEIYAQPDMTIKHKISTPNNNGKYFLVEFPMNSIPRFASQSFFDFILNGFIPVIAHPERNLGFITNPNMAFEFVQRGALMQINAGSILGKHGEKAKNLAFKLIEYNLAHIVGSDCHDPNRRSMSLAESYGVVSRNWDEDTAKMLFYNNPKKFIDGTPIEILEPIPIETESKSSFWQKFSVFKRKKVYY
jgi:protein-tyrosine phosphatase